MNYDTPFHSRNTVSIITGEWKQSDVEYSIYNSLGQFIQGGKLKVDKNSNKQVLTISNLNLESGIYLLLLKDDTDITFRESFIKL